MQATDATTGSALRKCGTGFQPVPAPVENRCHTGPEALLQQAARRASRADSYWHRLSGNAVLAGFVTHLVLAGAAGTTPRRVLADAAPPTARGFVYHDRNGNGGRDSGEEGLPGVGVSNGCDLVQTDARGHWQLPSDEDAVFFVIKPSGWMTPLDRNRLPRFYYLHKPAGSPPLAYGGVPPTGPLPESIDFPLQPLAEPDRFQVLVFADPQPRNLIELDYVARDVVEGLVGWEAAFGVTLGDIVYDDLTLFEPLNQVVGQIGVPWYNVIGNHDMNYDGPDGESADDTFERVYGPSYYSFNYGPVHFVALNTVKVLDPDDQGRRHYVGEIGTRQLDFIRNDLVCVPADRLVVFLMHIPFHADDSPNTQVADRQALFRLIEDRPHTFSLTGHMHYHRHDFFGPAEGWHGSKPHHQVINVTVSGSWWKGAPDESGIPHATMADGAPNGCSVVTFDGPKVTTVRVQAARREPDYQMNIYASPVVPADRASDVEVLVNVFGGSEASRVELRINNTGPWRPMEQVAAEDPAYAALKAAEADARPPPGRPLPPAISSPHLWRATLPADLPTGMHRLDVRETDVFGQLHTGVRLIRVR